MRACVNVVLILPSSFFFLVLELFLQLFFEDSVRNIQSGKRVGLDTVLVSS